MNKKEAIAFIKEDPTEGDSLRLPGRPVVSGYTAYYVRRLREAARALLPKPRKKAE